MNARSALMLLLLASASSRALADAPTFPAEAKRVTVDVVVVGEHGQPIAGLKPEDFVVKENGVVHDILEFEAVDVSQPRALPQTAETPRVATNSAGEDPGRAFLVVLDELNLSPSSVDRVRRALTRFLDVELRDGDRVTLAPTGGGGWWTGRMPHDRADLQAALQRLQGRRIADLRPERLSDYEAMRIEADHDLEVIDHVTQRFSLYGLVAPVVQDSSRAELDHVGGHALVRGLAAEIYQNSKERTRATLRNVERALDALALGRGRRSVILVSDGFVHDPRITELQRVREAARHRNAAVYFIDARGLRRLDIGGADQPMPADPLNMPVVTADPQGRAGFMSREIEYDAAANVGADALAADTGGFTVTNTNDLATGLARLTRESRTYYLLGYEPKDKRQDGRFRKIQVEVRRPDVAVRARKGYYAPGGKQTAADATIKRDPGAPDPAVARALDAVVGDREIPLRLTTYVLGAAAEGRVTVVLTAEADPAALALENAGGTFQGAMETFSLVSARDTGEVGRHQRVVELALRPEVRAQMAKTWVPVSHRFELPPGRYQASLAVRDKKSGRMGSVRQSFDVPELRSLRLTTPILTDVHQRAAAAEAAAPVPIARRSFAPGARLVCTFGVEGGRRNDQTEPRVAVTYEVRRTGGTVVTRTEPTPLRPDASGALTSRFTLALNRPGSYEIHLTARDESSAEMATAVESFVVEAQPDATPAGM